MLKTILKSLAIYLLLIFMSFFYDIYWEETLYTYEPSEIDLGDNLQMKVELKTTNASPTFWSILIPFYSNWIESGPYRFSLTISDLESSPKKICITSATLTSNQNSSVNLVLLDPIEERIESCFKPEFLRYIEEGYAIIVQDETDFELSGNVKIAISFKAHYDQFVIDKSHELIAHPTTVHESGWSSFLVRPLSSILWMLS